MALVYLALAWCAGIWLAHQLWGLGVIGCRTAAAALAAPALIALIVAGALRRRRAIRGPAILLAVALLGAWRYQAQPFVACPAPDRLATYNGTAAAPVQATVEGVIVGYPDVRDTRTFYRVRADRLTVAGPSRPVQGDVLVQTGRFPAFAYGDRVRATGQLVTPPTFDDFDYAAYLSTRGIHSLLRRGRVELIAHEQGHPFWAALYRLRAAGSALLNRVLPEPAAALANGMLLGIESGIPPAVDEAFKATGTAHVIVISGSNIALLTGVLMGVLGRSIGKAHAPLPVVVAIVLYVLLVGADPPALRAGIMGILYVVAAALG
ncbi:MAG: ComEC/Rec2 family competence protein, partial [Anaerolineae bacterium]|nr:ComEC/Rec2 family competence protein [Anaerolineae bacterium]